MLAINPPRHRACVGTPGCDQRRLLCVRSPWLLAPFAWHTRSEKARLSLLSVFLTPAGKGDPGNTAHKNTGLDLPGPVLLHLGQMSSGSPLPRGETEAERGPRRHWPCLQTSLLCVAPVCRGLGGGGGFRRRGQGFC